MRKSIRISSISFVLLTLIISACSSPSEKVSDAEDNVKDAKEELKVTNEEYKVEMEEYKVRTNKEIEANEKSIKEFNARIDDQKSEAKADYQKKIDDLNAKNTDMKKRMDDFKTDSQTGWDKFKTEFAEEFKQSLLIVTHDSDFANKSHRIIEMEDGKIKSQ